MTTPFASVDGELDASHFSDTDIGKASLTRVRPSNAVRSAVKAEARAKSKSKDASGGLYKSFFKRALDVMLILLAAPFVVPVVALMALVVAMDGHSPFYSQMRIGRGGRHFRIWKLRTMVVRADELLEDYLAQNPAAREEWDKTQKLKKDPRITLVGRILRKSSLDELPQLFNVLKGEMSLVGPRPMMVCQRDDYHGEAYFKLAPGITGLWQISDRNESEFVARVGFDNAYESAVSLKTDVTILFKTVLIVLRGTGY